MAVPAPTRTLARVIFAVALVGILVVTHLSLQIEKGFADGCAGLGATISAEGMTAAPEAACAAVATGEYKDFLGVSNVVWGLLFYVVVALLRLGYGMTGDRRLRLAAFGAVAVGALYTLRLVYLQAFVIEAFCVLCMASAATVAVLLVLHVVEHLKASGEVAPTREDRAATLRPYVAVAGAFLVLLAADVVLAGGGEEPAAPGTETASNALAPEAQARPASDAPASLAPPLPSGCAYDPQFAPIEDLSAFTSAASQGTGPVTVVDVFDPNCPHCRQLHEALKPVIAANLDKATFYFVPFPLRQPSLGQAAALVLAEREGRFFPLMEEFFARQDNTWGMTGDEIREAANSAGLDGPSIVATMQDQESLQGVLEVIQATSTAVQNSFSNADGGLSVPKLAINGRVVASTEQSYSTECLNQFIADAAGITAVVE